MTSQRPLLAPSILAADFTKLGEDIRQAVAGGATWIHCDIMDGHFVPNISYGPDLVKAVRRAEPDAFLDVHLMIEEPDRYIDAFVEAGADLISVHVETCPHLHRTLQTIRSAGCKCGAVINPATPVEMLRPVVADIDLALIMSVNPGFGGQHFIPTTYQKVHQLRTMRQEEDASFLIEIDGGVGPDNIRTLTEAGVDVLVAGSSVFRAENIEERVQELIRLANLGRRNFV